MVMVNDNTRLDMIKQYTTQSDPGFEWIDLVSPDRAEVQEIARKFGLHEASVEDALQPDHLPKFEKLKTYSFVIMRIYSVGRESEADTVQELTNKLAIFFSDKFIVTVHKHEWKDFEVIDNEFLKNGDCKNAFQQRGIFIFKKHAFFKIIYRFVKLCGRGIKREKAK
ncbi:MAG: hypothetical protein EOO04_31940, partial [Chitinophagaceae bacterium]